VSPVPFTNGTTTGVSATRVGADNITSGSDGGDSIYGDGGPDRITLLSNHSLTDTVLFGEDAIDDLNHVLAITDGSDVAYPGFWGVITPITIPTLFVGSSTGGTSADMTTITGFHAGSGNDQLIFNTAAWNGASVTSGFLHFAVEGDLVGLIGAFVVPTGAAQLSVLWTDSSSNSSLKATDNVLLYAPSDVSSLQNAQQLAARLHTSDAVTLPGLFGPAQDMHILVAYKADNNLVNIADVDLVNMSGNPQNSTANLNVYASDMVHLVGVSLSSLTSDNIHFI
jgi:hypothetical protein